MSDNIRLGRLAGFPVGLNWSVLLLLGVFTWSLAGSSLPAAAPGHAPAVYWLAGFGASVLLLASLLGHELAHAVVARRAGIEVKAVTLWMFGGQTSLGGEASRPGLDLRIAVAGPATSLALAAVSAGVAAAGRIAAVAHIVTTAIWWLAGANLLLGLFNLLPGAPLDGGRILRAYLWHRRGDQDRATIGAARAGKVLGYVLIGVGVLELVSGRGAGGLWMGLLGWFLFGAARNEQATVIIRQRLAGVRVADVMSAPPRSGPSWLTVQEFIDRYALDERHSAYPVEDLSGSVDGLVTLAQLTAMPAKARATVRVRDVAMPVRQVPSATPTEPLLGLLDRWWPTAGGWALVFDDGRLAGVVTATDISQALQLATVGPLPRRHADAPTTAGHPGMPIDRP